VVVVGGTSGVVPRPSTELEELVLAVDKDVDVVDDDSVEVVDDESTVVDGLRGAIVAGNDWVDPSRTTTSSCSSPRVTNQRTNAITTTAATHKAPTTRGRTSISDCR
jgi:hypothetical protein